MDEVSFWTVEKRVTRLTEQSPLYNSKIHLARADPIKTHSSAHGPCMQGGDWCRKLGFDSILFNEKDYRDALAVADDQTIDLCWYLQLKSVSIKFLLN